MVVLSQHSQGSSSSSSNPDNEFDVFLSFRGHDTRRNFTDHLHKALVDATITTFLDDAEIETGLSLKPELESAIKASRASIIVLSPNYASSTWCLNELVLILEQHRTSNHIVIPIFYHVEPTDVRKQQSSFGDAMAKHKQTMEAQTNAEEKGQLAEKMEIWKKALSEVADLKGKDAKGRLETEFIEEIVKDIYHRLGLHLKSAQPRLIGVNYSIDVITSWLKEGSSHTVDILTILGMGGIGKTSLAKYVYGLQCHAFDKSSFVHDIGRRCYSKFNGIRDLQIELCGDFPKRSHIQVHDVSAYTSKIENTLARKKVFLVLDDVNSVDQLDVLLGSKGFHPGSKIIITTKDVSLIERCALFSLNVPPKHTNHFLRGLGRFESLELLCIHAFMSNKPKEGYEDVAIDIVEYCAGHPLALEVLGRSLRNQDVAYWVEHKEGLKKEPDSHIQKALQMSFDSLPYENDKELFKHIACFFVGQDRVYTERILKACDIRTLHGITNLIDRCLLTIGRQNELKMHQLIQDMGRDVVRQESPNKPWKRSRLWCHEDSFNVLEQNKGSGKIKGLVLDMETLEKETLCGSDELKTDALSKMDNLMLLHLNSVQLSGSYKNFPKKLRWLCMRGSPLKSIPSDLQMELVVDLDMSYSNLESFDMPCGNLQQHGKGRKLRSLKILNLSFCKLLRNIGGFFELPSLERLLLANCTGLIEVCESIEHCDELLVIDLRNCKMFRKLSRTMVKLKKVEKLLLDGCNHFDFAIEMKDKKSLEMFNAKNSGIDLQTSSSANALDIPRDFESLLIYLPSSLVNLSLQDCNLSDSSFPMDFSCLSALKILKLDGNPIISMPDCVRSLCKLEILTMRRCIILKTVVYPPRTLRELSLVSLDRLRLQTIVFVQEMSPLILKLNLHSLAYSSFIIEGMVKIHLMAHVKEEMLHSLGWTNLEFIKNREVTTANIWTGTRNVQVQMYFEFGIFSTFYWGREIPDWISERSQGPSISFTVPSSLNNLRGINFCYVWTSQVRQKFPDMPMIRISNITKNRTWIYNHYIESVGLGNESLTFLSHWLLGKKELEDGDRVSITIIRNSYVHDSTRDLNVRDLNVRECGVSLLYDDDLGKMEEDDPLGYYKSWNHIIGGDLSGFQLTTGEYFLDIRSFWRDREIASYHHPYIAEYARYKGRVTFTAFSKGTPNVRLLKELVEIFELGQEQEMQEELEKIEQEHEIEMQYITKRRHPMIQEQYDRVTRMYAKLMQEQIDEIQKEHEEEMQNIKETRHSMVQERNEVGRVYAKLMQEQIDEIEKEHEEEMQNIKETRHSMVQEQYDRVTRMYAKLMQEQIDEIEKEHEEEMQNNKETRHSMVQEQYDSVTRMYAKLMQEQIDEIEREHEEEMQNIKETRHSMVQEQYDRVTRMYAKLMQEQIDEIEKEHEEEMQNNKETRHSMVQERNEVGRVYAKLTQEQIDEIEREHEEEMQNIKETQHSMVQEQYDSVTRMYAKLMQEQIDEIEKEHEEEMQNIKEMRHSMVQERNEVGRVYAKLMQEQIDEIEKEHEEEMQNIKETRHSMVQERNEVGRVYAKLIQEQQEMQKRTERCEQVMQEKIERIKQEWTTKQPE